MTKEDMRRNCDYWMMEAIKDTIRAKENNYPRTMIAESIGSANQVLLLAAPASLGVITPEEFDTICKILSQFKGRMLYS